MLTFEIPAVKCHHSVEVNWSRYRDTGVTDPALYTILQIGTDEIQCYSSTDNIQCYSIPNL